MKIPRDLDALEIRVLGSLLEKQQATPEYYPLTVNALQAACNQKSNREPVMEVAEEEIAAALDRLKERQLVWRVLGGRAVRWEHNLDKLWDLGAPAKAVLTLLLLRGPQTPGELRARSDRLYPFNSLEEVEQVLQNMANAPEPLTAESPRRPGQKETRWTHLIGGSPASPPVDAPAGPTGPELRAAQPAAESLERRIERLETLVDTLAEELNQIKLKLWK